MADDEPSYLTRRLVNHCAADAATLGVYLRYIPVMGSHGPSAARNAGRRIARGEILAFTDDDCIPMPDWLRYGVASFVGNVAGASGKIIVPRQSPPTDYERDLMDLELVGEFITANCFYRSDILDLVGGFDERFTIPWREDTDLFFTLLERGYNLVNAVAAVVVHPVRPAPWGISVRLQRKSMFNALLYKKHPTLYRQRVQAMPPWRYYTIVFVAFLTLWYALRGQRQRALVAFGLWALLTCWFCAQRLHGTARSPSHIAEMVITSMPIPFLSTFWRILGGVKFRVVFL